MDNRRQELQENYEDALFALLMDDFAQFEGERLYEESKRLQDDPSVTLPKGMETRTLKTIRKAFRKKRIRTASKIGAKVVSQIAVVVLALNIAFCTSFFTVEAFRLEVLQMALRTHKTHTTVQFINEAVIASQQEYLSAADLQAVIPEEYELVKYENYPDAEYADFVAPDGSRIMWDSLPIQTTFDADTEDADYFEIVTINGHEGIIIEKNDFSTVLWGDVDDGKEYCISADMKKEDLLDIVMELVA